MNNINWISTKIDKPKLNSNYLCILNDYENTIDILNYDIYSFKFNDYEWTYNLDDILFWSELPDLPEELNKCYKKTEF